MKVSFHRSFPICLTLNIFSCPEGILETLQKVLCQILSVTIHILTLRSLVLACTLFADNMNLERANSPFPSPASGGATTPPATPVHLSNPQHVASTPETNHTANSVTGTLEDVLPRLKEELHGRHVPNMPLHAFLKHFVTLEDAQCKLSLVHLFSESKPPGF